MSVSLGVSMAPAMALAQVAPLDPAEADVSDLLDSDSEPDLEATPRLPPLETEMNGEGPGSV
jgi:hypothetical protein